ncbi:MAG: hypothetical protein KGJ57_01460 [Sphingomonadales bacterium]|nr:hypothetical protein [Sphingomonadales bacterium]MDE2168075.1 hypothetical protein [Sphingomonadales bacterium]
MKRISSLFLVMMVVGAEPSAAQDSEGEARPLTAAQRAQALIDEERQLVKPRALRADCPAPDPLNKAIVVCAPDTSQRYRVPASSDDPHDIGGARGGLTPPDMYGGMPCGAGCARVRGGYAPPPVYYIDLSKIPEAPPGSDADKIAKGEARAP